MIYEASTIAVLIFGAIVAFTLGLSFYLGSRARSAKGYFAAGGGIHWFVNGVAFAGDYLSAASFLGICGMIAFYGYDGFLYSIGYLAGWIVALFVIAEPLKRMGKYTFADALDSRFNSSGIKLAAAISTLAVSIFYLIPQMVGAGALIKPLLGFSHEVGVVLVGAVVILIVATAGMVSTTYVQFLKGSLLVIFSTVLTVMILNRGIMTQPMVNGEYAHAFGSNIVLALEEVSIRNKDHVKLDAGDAYLNNIQKLINVQKLSDTRERATQLAAFNEALKKEFPDHHASIDSILPESGPWVGKPYVRVQDLETGRISVWRKEGEKVFETQTVTVPKSGPKLVNGVPQRKAGQTGNDLFSVGTVSKLPDGKTATGPLGPLEFLSTIQQSEVELWRNDIFVEPEATTTVYYRVPTAGNQVLRPGNLPAFKGIRSEKLVDKLNFLSLMLALFCGTASLPHILIRYYTVKDQEAARKSTIVGIGSIGFFYVLTLFIGLGAMTSGSLDVTNTNMAAPLLAKSFNPWLFAIISAIAFTTVLGTVSGLIIAAAGAVVHDLMSSYLKIEMNDHSKVRIAKIASVVVGVIAIVLGIVFEKMNVSYLVGWAFSVAASANLPSLVMLLFWRGTTKQGITAAVTVGMVSSLAWILLSGDTYKEVYGWNPETAIVPFSQPGIVTIPLGFLVLVLVSLVTQPKQQGSVA